MDTEKAILDTELYQERLSKKKNSIICTTTLTSQVV